MNRSRLVLGSVLIVLSLLPYALVPIVPFVGLSAVRATASIGIIALVAESLGLLAVVVLGTEAARAMKDRVFKRRTGDRGCNR